jgi:hypothetical protein
MKKLLCVLWLFLALLLWAGFAFAQQTTPTTLAPPSIKWGGGSWQTPPPGMLIGYDSATQHACIVGSTATCLLAVSTSSQGAATPNACDTATVATGGTAVSPLSTTTVLNGGYITNPLTSTDQGIGAAEALYIDPTTTATTTGNGTNLSLAAGQSFYFPSGTDLKNVSVNAATSGHKFTCARW